MKKRPEETTPAGLTGYGDLSELANGTFATVYRATEVATGRPVALKVLKLATVGEGGRELAAAFDHELDALARLGSHPNIATLYGSFVTTDGRPVLVLELCRESLADRAGRNGPLPLEEVLATGVKVCGALESAHRQGLLHRDIKPRNLLVSAFGEPVLADFGMSTLQALAQSSEGLFGFTALHAPPEALEGHPLSPSSDVYALASALYQLACGRAPFAPGPGEAPASQVLRVLREPAPAPPPGALPDGFVAVLLAALAKEPAARPQSASAFAEALQTVEAALGLVPTRPAVQGLPAGVGQPPAPLPGPPTPIAAEHEGPTSGQSPGSPVRMGDAPDPPAGAVGASGPGVAAPAAPTRPRPGPPAQVAHTFGRSVVAPPARGRTVVDPVAAGAAVGGAGSSGPGADAPGRPVFLDPFGPAAHGDAITPPEPDWPAGRPWAAPQAALSRAHFLWFKPGQAVDFDAHFASPAATVADLTAALAGQGLARGDESGLFLDGAYHPAGEALLAAGMHEGAVLSPFPLPAGFVLPRVTDGPVACVLTGMEAGRCLPLAPTGTTVGHGPGTDLNLPDPTVLPLHCRLAAGPDGEPVVTDLSLAGVTWVDGEAVPPGAERTFAPGEPVRLGAAVVSVATTPTTDRAPGVGLWSEMSGTGTWHFNRPPRNEPARVALALSPPQEPSPSAPSQALSVAAVAAPLVFGLVMVLAMHSALYALFALLSPVMAVGTWWENNRKSARSRGAASRAFQRQLEQFEQEALRARQAEKTALRDQSPSAHELLRRAFLPSRRLWERRPAHNDFLRLSIGLHDTAWRPLLAGPPSPAGTGPGPRVEQLLGSMGTMPEVPRLVDLSSGGVLGIAGPRSLALGLARHLACQAAVLHGPADLRLVVVSAEPTDLADADWGWAKWLPHARQGAGGGQRRLVAAGPQAVSDLLNALLAESTNAPATAPYAALGGPRPPEGRTTLYLVDGEELLTRPGSPARQLLDGAGGPAAGIVVASSPDRLPSVCSEVVVVSELAEATVRRPQDGGAPSAVRPAGLPADLARACAMSLARLEDPEVHDEAALPDLVRLGALFGVDEWSPAAVAANWAANRGGSSLRAPIGMAGDGAFALDLDRHGPHGLIGGTTGSGKSELLKTLVAALAATYPPSELTFGLVDFKGGSTFVELARLPHTVGMASDLDLSLAKRALRCLRAELVHRELVFDQAGVKDLSELAERRAMGDPMASQAEALPRLVVIIDEFAAMTKELSEEIGALADLTARGRSLGVHLLLATQKPSTAVNAEIRANTRLRICLQVEDRQDSLDVVGTGEAAEIDHKGRGYFRVGQGEVVPIQTGWSTGPLGGSERAAAELVPFLFQAAPVALPEAPRAVGTTELQALIAAIAAAFAGSGEGAPRAPWPPALPARLTLQELAAVPPDLSRAPDDIYFALADDPDRQTRYPVGWPMRNGNLLVYGVLGSGTTTALASVALAFAADGPPARRHLYVVDSGAGDLAPLAALPHCGSVVRASDREMHIQLLATLTRELTKRRAATAMPGPRPIWLVVVDNLESLRASYDDQQVGTFWDQFVRVWSEGPDVGIYIAGGVSRFGALPAAIAGATPTKYMFKLADIAEFANVGIPRTRLPSFVPGRAIMAGSAQVVQVALPSPSLASAVAEIASGAYEAGLPGRPQPLVALRDIVRVSELAGGSAVGDERWDLGLGQRESDGATAVLSLYEGESALVCGPARSGKSTALLTAAACLAEATGGRGRVLAYGGRRSPLRSHPLVEHCATSADELAELAARALVIAGPVLVLVDDVESLGEPDAGLSTLVNNAHPHLRVFVAGRPDALRSMYGHWTNAVRRSRSGILLQPALERDGELLGARLPYRLHVAMPAGRGFVVCNGEAVLAQVATP